jgi:tRNA pseudouridine55 synthase
LPEAPFGFLNINKPPGVTSHDVVAQARRSLHLKRIGHAGTLDPLASGVLVLCIGQATRLSEYVMQTRKRYLARIHLGVITETYDAEGKVIAEQDVQHITRENVVETLAAFIGEIEQTPPMYSAVKRGGRKLYELARAGQVVERAARQVYIETLALRDWSPPQFTLEVICSPGTYIRSLAHDLGQALGVGAYLAGLVRTASGAFTLEEAIPLEALGSDPDWQQFLVSPRKALPDWPNLTLTPEEADHIRHGRPIAGSGAREGTLALAWDDTGRLVAVVKAGNSIWRPHKVF